MGPEMITSLTGAVDTSISPFIQHFTNVKNRKFAREMYGRQRQDALSDWNMMNAYNSPKAQMARFEEAGLNRNLIYGQTNEGAQMRASSMESGNAEAPGINSQGAYMSIYDMKLKSAQADLVAKQLELVEAQKYATVAGTGKTDAETKKILFDLGIESDLRSTTIEGRQKNVELLNQNILKGKEEIKRIIAETDYTTVNANKLHAELIQLWKVYPLQLKDMMETILLKQAQRAKSKAETEEINAKIKLLHQEFDIKGIDQYLAKRNINPKDPFWSRSIQDLITRLFGRKR